MKVFMKICQGVSEIIVLNLLLRVTGVSELIYISFYSQVAAVGEQCFISRAGSWRSGVLHSPFSPRERCSPGPNRKMITKNKSPGLGEYNIRGHRNQETFMYSVKLAEYMIETMMTSSNGNIFRVTGSLCVEFTGRGWIPLTKASDAELRCFLLSAPGQTVE